MYMPIGGEILEFNPALTSSPELINKDPYGEGWVIRIRIENADELNELLTDEQYRELIGA
jgi:glycine cleavage system H protein